MIKTVRSYAKINLFLYVTGKRDDGYHDLCSLMTQISLHDDIQIDFSADQTCVICDHPDVPEDQSNLVFKAVQLFNKNLESKKIKAHLSPQIKIVKRIPPGGGLGGGSSNAATVLIALNEAYEKPFSKAELMSLGLELGADVPFFIFGDCALAKGVGEKLQQVPKLKPYHLLLCDPGIGASTAKVFKNIDFGLTFKQKGNIKSGLNVMPDEHTFDVKDFLHNDLEEPACRLYPEIGKTKEEIETLLEQTVFMSGSGSSLFVLFSDLESARQSVKTLEKNWGDDHKQVYLCTFK